jgi:hypothetical protein
LTIRGSLPLTVLGLLQTLDFIVTARSGLHKGFVAWRTAFIVGMQNAATAFTKAVALTGAPGSPWTHLAIDGLLALLTNRRRSDALLKLGLQSVTILDWHALLL